MIKIKPCRTADCVVGGFRYLSNQREVGSLLLGLYDGAGRLNHVGFTATIPNPERAGMTRRLGALREPPGFTGDAPGGHSRWSTDRSGAWEPVRPELVVEVSFNQITAGRFRHGATRVRWRPDKEPANVGRISSSPCNQPLWPDATAALCGLAAPARSSHRPCGVED